MDICVNGNVPHKNIIYIVNLTRHSSTARDIIEVYWITFFYANYCNISSSEKHFQHHIFHIFHLCFNSLFFQLVCNSLSEKCLRALLCNYLHSCSILKEVFYFSPGDWASHLQKCVGLSHRRVNSVNAANTVWRLCSCKSPRKQDSETAIILAQV